MRTNRSGYSASPAGSAKALNQKPRPKRPKREINQMLLLIFFIALPVLGLLAIFFQPMRWIFIIAALLAIAAMWALRAFLFPGRMILSSVYGLLCVFTLVTALSAGSDAVVGHSNTLGANGAGIQTASPTQTPAFNYSLMGTSVPDDYYTTPEPTSEAGTDETDTNFVDGTTQINDGMISGDSEAEQALANFMTAWQHGLSAEMVQYTAPSWRSAQVEEAGAADGAETKLFWKFNMKPLETWRQLGTPTGTSSNTARTIKVQADIQAGGKTTTYEYDAIALSEGGVWYIDPDSLSTGVLVAAATPTPDPNATPTPEPTPTPVPTPDPKTQLYYNEDGGSFYHIDAECSSVGTKYRPLKGKFKYSDLEKSPYNALKPCEVCGAPERVK